MMCCSRAKPEHPERQIVISEYAWRLTGMIEFIAENAR